VNVIVFQETLMLKVSLSRLKLPGRINFLKREGFPIFLFLRNKDMALNRHVVITVDATYLLPVKRDSNSNKSNITDKKAEET